jgi:hypothetical protein
MDRAPVGGSFQYSRKIPLSARVMEAFETGRPVLVVHGIDYNSSGTFDDVLGQSEVDRNLVQEVTAPALCAPLVAAPASGAPPKAAALLSLRRPRRRRLSNP